MTEIDRHDPTQHTQAEKDWAKAKMQEWADSDSEMKRKVNDVFNDRRTNG